MTWGQLRLFNGSQADNSLPAKDGNNQPACGDERAAGDYRDARRLAEFDPGDNLSTEEKEHHVYPQQLAKFPAGGIDDQAVRNEGCRSQREGKNTADPGGPIESRLETRVAVGFKKGRYQQKNERAAAISDNLIKKFFHRKVFVQAS
jgi:hypothetical protein